MLCLFWHFVYFLKVNKMMKNKTVTQRLWISVWLSLYLSDSQAPPLCYSKHLHYEDLHFGCRYILLIIIFLECVATHITIWSKVMKIGTLIEESLSNSKFGVSILNPLAPAMCQSNARMFTLDVETKFQSSMHTKRYKLSDQILQIWLFRFCVT